MRCAGSRTITSRASEGVKEGRASKIGVVSGEAIRSKQAASKFWWKLILSVPDPILCGPMVSVQRLDQKFDSRCGGHFFRFDASVVARLPSPIPSSVSCRLPPKCMHSG